MTTKAVLIVGANSGLAQALCQQILASSEHTILRVARHSRDEAAMDDTHRVINFDCDQTEQGIELCAQMLMDYEIQQVFICTGFLHHQAQLPEKQLTDFSADFFHHTMQVNCVIPSLWLAQLGRIVRSNHADIVIFSARVGSISDNKLGGWYSYRASKAALNMMVKSAAIELRRRHKHWRFVLYHPGTADTALSKPFQKNVPEGKLFAPQFSASQLLQLIPTLDTETTVHYVDWQGKPIEW